MDTRPAVLRNVTKQAGNWLELRLVGDVSKKSPRDATGAIVYLTTGKMRQRADLFSGASFGSANDARLHFGLGAATRVDKLEVKWPDGTLETFNVPAVNRVMTLTEGKGASTRK
jgi:hypothetical protein